MPGAPCWKKKSPTMAPITDRPAALRRPVKIDGTAAGNCSLSSTCARVARLSRNRSCAAALADCRPKKVFEIIGKTAMITQTTTRAGKP